MSSIFVYFINEDKPTAAYSLFNTVISRHKKIYCPLFFIHFQVRLVSNFNVVVVVVLFLLFFFLVVGCCNFKFSTSDA